MPTRTCAIRAGSPGAAGRLVRAAALALHVAGAALSCAADDGAPPGVGGGGGEGGGGAAACPAGCAAPLVCDAIEHACVGCVTDSQCAPGAVCAPEGECVPGCSPAQPCPGGAACCGGVCRDLGSDLQSCGSCDRGCPALAHAEGACVAGVCDLGACESGFADCNQDAADGCEQDTAISGPCRCTPGETSACYLGPPGTEGVGPCAAGLSTCRSDGASWGSCVGQVLPLFEACADGVDNDCNGTVDDTPDQDGDGWTVCDGDCCDSPLDGCGAPALVNRGAFDVPDNSIDDDCDGTVDNAAACDAGLASDSGSGLDYAKAVDLCATTLADPPTPAQRTWGVIRASLARADGTGAPAASQRAIRRGFGSGVTPLRGDRLVVLSTGVAAAQASPNNTSPSFAPFQGGQNMGTSSAVPADWLAANAGNLPNAPGCPEPQGGATANDPVMLKLRVRVPTNAISFTVSAFFYASEYPEWVCSAFNDFFLALLDSAFVPAPGQLANPADKNLAFYDPPPAGGPVYPLGVNLAFGGTGLFRQCLGGPTGCGSGAVAGTTSSCTGIAQLLGTGFDVTRPSAQFAGEPGWCGSSDRTGGGTGWLVISGNVSPGETMELRFALWDTGDHWYDSVALLDDFRWSSAASTPGTRN
jgi:hypothetical protein